MKRAILLVVILLAIALVAFAQTQINTWAPPNDGQTHLTYDVQHRTYHLTRTDNTFGNVLIFDNSAEPGYPNTHDFSADSVNADGQHSIVTYHWSNSTQSYIVSSALDLDQDGHLSLGAGSGGGIATDPGTGDTCVPYNANANGSCNVSTSLHINQSGMVSQYLGLATAGRGISPIVSVVDGSATGTVNNYPVWTTPSSGYGATEFYEVSWVGVVTGPSLGTTAVATWTFTDPSGPNSCSSPLTPFGSVGNRLELTCHFYSVANTPIKVSVTTTGSPTYASNLRVIIH